MPPGVNRPGLPPPEQCNADVGPPVGAARAAACAHLVDCPPPQVTSRTFSVRTAALSMVPIMGG